MNEHESSDALDRELTSIAAIIRALDGHAFDDKQRILRYVGERLRLDPLTVDTQELMTNLAAAMDAVNKAAKQLQGRGVKITGAELIGVVVKMYREAANDSAGGRPMDVGSGVAS